jgi:4-hydroxybenzoyl-CoA thioesterase
VYDPDGESGRGAKAGRKGRSRLMLTGTREVLIHWGDCDPAGIVYYPRYFEWFDVSTHNLFLKAGFPTEELAARFGVIGYAMVDTRARFILPSKFGDVVIIETAITEFRRSSFLVHHKLTANGQLAAEGFETRVWTASDGDRIKSKAIPDEIKRRFLEE